MWFMPWLSTKPQKMRLPHLAERQISQSIWDYILINICRCFERSDIDETCQWPRPAPSFYFHLISNL